jgi:tetratricopeptide (TPR) repeat protein
MRNPHNAARDDDEFDSLSRELEVPRGFAGFGNYLVWMVATRAAGLVDAIYDSGVARPSREYQMRDGHHLPTQAMIAHFIVANQSSIDPARLPRDDGNIHKAQRSLSATMTYAMGAEPQRFRVEWLRGIAALCALDEKELRLLENARSKPGMQLDPAALRQAVTATRAAGLPADRHPSGPVDSHGPAGAPTTQVVVGQVPREPPGFVARDLIETLAVAAVTGQVAMICAVTGLRGVGKTQLAAAYARRRVNDGWGLVAWIDAETRQSLVVGLAAVAGRLGVADPRADSERSASRLRDELQSRTADGLLVLDNAVSPEDVAPFLMASGGTQIVITSTNQEFAQLGVPVNVSVFTSEESVRYLRERTGLTDTTGAAAVAAALGYLPLALAQAASALASQRLSYQEYLERLRTVPTGQVLRGIRGLYPQGVAAALLDSVRTAEADEIGGPRQTTADGPTGDGVAGRLLRVMAVLSPAGVSRHLLAGLAALPYAVDEAAERCVTSSLLTWSVSGDELIMHRLLARALRERDQEEGRWQQTVTLALGLLEPSLFPESQAMERRIEGSQLAAHVDAVWAVSTGTTAAGCPLTLDLIRRLLRARNWAVRQLAGAADLAAAVDAGARLLAACGELLGEDDRVTVAARHALAVAYGASGQLSEARAHYEQTLADRRRLFGDDDLDTLEALNGCGETNLALERPEEAVPQFEQALRGRERVLPPGDYLIFESRINLAVAMSMAGKLAEAIDLDEQTYAGRLETVGSDHPDTDFVRGNLAYKYRIADRLTEATTLNEELYQARRRVLGDHQLTFIAATNLGACYADTGQPQKAAALHEYTLKARLRLLGREHPDTMRSRHALAVTYAALGRYDEAIHLHELNLTERLRYLSPDHPHTTMTIDALEAARATAARDPALGAGLNPGRHETLSDRVVLLVLSGPALARHRTRPGPAFPATCRYETGSQMTLPIPAT